MHATKQKKVSGNCFDQALLLCNWNDTVRPKITEVERPHPHPGMTTQNYLATGPDYFFLSNLREWKELWLMQGLE